MTGTRNPKVLIAHDEPEQFRSILEGRFPKLLFTYATDADEVLEALSTVRPEVALSIKHVDFPGSAHRPIVDHPDMQWVHVGGSGYEQFLPWDAERVTLTNSAGVLARYLAETVTGAMLMLNSNLHRYLHQQRVREWRQHGFQPMCDKTLLIVGVGAIGGYIADNAKALGMRVLGVRGSDKPHPSVDEMHPPSELKGLLGQADVVSVHVRANDETHHMMNAQTLAAMKPGSMFINTSRGSVVDEAALHDAVISGHIGSAYLDVFETEPLPSGSPLWDLPNVLITPHTADSVDDWQTHFARFFADNLERWCNGQELRNIVLS